MKNVDSEFEETADAAEENADVRVLVVSPHADDAEFGMGPLLARFVDYGMHVTLLLLSASTYTASSGETVLGGDRIREQQCAAKRLGIDLRIDRVAEENEFFNAPRGQMVAAIEKCFDSVRPDIFFIPSPSVNQDHVVAYDACLSAIRPPRDRNLSAVHVYDSTVVGRPASMPGVPFVWEVLPSDVSAAQDALHMHKSQMTGASQSLVRLAPVRWLYSGQQNGLSHAVVTYVLQGRALCP